MSKFFAERVFPEQPSERTNERTARRQNKTTAHTPRAHTQLRLDTHQRRHGRKTAFEPTITLESFLGGFRTTALPDPDSGFRLAYDSVTASCGVCRAVVDTAARLQRILDRALPFFSGTLLDSSYTPPQQPDNPDPTQQQPQATAQLMYTTLFRVPTVVSKALELLEACLEKHSRPPTTDELAAIVENNIGS